MVFLVGILLIILAVLVNSVLLGILGLIIAAWGMVR